MEIIIDTIVKAVQDNLAQLVLLLITISSLYIINIVLGTILGKVEEGFSWKKFFFGFIKGLIANLCIFAFGYILNLFSLILATLNIQIDGTVITTIEIILVAVAWGIDLSQDIIEKIKSMRELKYISYDDVKLSPQENSQEELG